MNHIHAPKLLEHLRGWLGRRPVASSVTTEDVIAISAALRDDEAVIDSALERIASPGAAREEDIQWLAAEAARYLERRAQQRHPGVASIFASLDLQGDAGVVSRAVWERLQRRLLHAGRRRRSLTALQVQGWADDELLLRSGAELRRALNDERLRARVGAPRMPRWQRVELDFGIFDRADPIGALRHELRKGCDLRTDSSRSSSP